MTKTAQILFSIIALLVIGGIVLVATISFEDSEPTTGESVATTIFPLYDITKNIAGDSIEVIQVLPTGASPHTYEPTTAVVRDVASAQVLYAIGAGLDDWAGSIGENAGTPVVEFAGEFDLLEGDEDEEGHGHDGNPHIWLSIDNVLVLSRLIAEDLAERFPEHSETIAMNLDDYATELAKADSDIQKTLANVQGQNIITFHDSFPYFAEAYGLTLAGTFEPSPGQEPTPRYLEELQNAIQETNVEVIYSEPQLGTASLESFVNDIGAEIVELDPLGGAEGRETLIDMLLFNARTIAQHTGV